MATSDKAEDQTRRDFLYVATGAFGAVGAGALAWPFIDQMNPDASAVALASIEVDISSIEEGYSLTVKWRGKPVFIRNRTQAEVDEAKAVDVATLKDPQSDADRTKPGKENWLVQVGICTHLGCVPSGQKDGDSKGEFNGWFCPCHGSHYDISGRIRKGPAPLNLEIPPYEFLSDTIVKIG